jgi:hypothetical protein
MVWIGAAPSSILSALWNRFSFVRENSQVRLDRAALLGFVLFVSSTAEASVRRSPAYAGSEACRSCHSEIYAQWRLTPHARMLVDAKRDPSAVLASRFDESIPFSKSDIDYTVGSHWVQKYLTRIKGLLYVLPKAWNIPERRWEPETDWNWRERTYNLQCDGCHTVGFDAATNTFQEAGVGCEACHGPGADHVKTGGRAANIVSPAKLPPDRAQMICMSCHTDGTDKATETHPFPVGYSPGKDLNEYYADFFMPKPKSKGWYWGSMDWLERKRMYYFFQSKFYSTDRACDVCGFDRGTTPQAERYLSRNEYCGTCHKGRYENFFEHSGHRPQVTECTDCHLPKLAKSGQTYSIHDHKFDFSQPPPACTECHAPQEIRGKRECAHEPRDFRLRKVKYPREMTLFEACVACHKEKTVSWAREVTPGLVDRFVVRKSGKGAAAPVRTMKTPAR